MANTPFRAVPFNGENSSLRSDIKNLVLAPVDGDALPEIVYAEVPAQCPLLKLGPNHVVECIASQYNKELMVLIDDGFCSTCVLAAGQFLASSTCPHPDVVKPLK